MRLHRLELAGFGPFRARQIVDFEAFERDADRLDPADARRQALRFAGPRYEAELFGYIDGVLRPAARRAA